MHLLVYGCLHANAACACATEHRLPMCPCTSVYLRMGLQMFALLLSVCDSEYVRVSAMAQWHVYLKTMKASYPWPCPKPNPKVRDMGTRSMISPDTGKQTREPVDPEGNVTRGKFTHVPTRTEKIQVRVTDSAMQD